MAAPHDPAELELVRLAITCRVGGCCVWDNKALRVYKDQVALASLSAKEVQQFLVAQVCDG